MTIRNIISLAWTSGRTFIELQTTLDVNHNFNA